VAILDEAFAAIATATANTERNLANARELFENYRDDVLKGTGQGWRRCSLQEVCYRFEYGSSAKSQRTGEVPVLRMGNIQDGEIDFGDLVYSSDAQEMDRYRLKPGDVLFNRTNSAEHVGKTAIYRGGTEALFAGYLVRVNPVPDEVEPGYLNHYLNGRASREYGKSVMSQSVHQANISAGKLREYPFAFPDMDEQRKLVDGLDRMKAETAQVVVLCGKKLARLAELKQSILHQAFTGQLTAGPRQLELDLA
jgi:type I restriction enzyme S subunit